MLIQITTYKYEKNYYAIYVYIYIYIYAIDNIYIYIYIYDNRVVTRRCLFNQKLIKKTSPCHDSVIIYQNQHVEQTLSYVLLTTYIYIYIYIYLLTASTPLRKDTGVS